MSEQTKNSKQSSSAAAFAAESQQQRWVKYGANVALTIVVVLVLAALVVYIAQTKTLRKDTTAGGTYSLKPQTVKLIENLPQKVKIVGLFTRAKSSSERRVVDETESGEVKYQQVADLLQEYQQKSNGKVSVEMIDPTNDPKKLDQLFNEVMQKYGNDIKAYKDLLDAFPKTVAEINKLAQEDMTAVSKLPQSDDRKVQTVMAEVIGAVGVFPQWLENLSFQVKQQTELKVPDYKTASDKIKSRLEEMSEICAALLKRYAGVAADEKTPGEMKAFVGASKPRIEQIKKLADDLLAKTQGLASIKQLDELRQNKTNSIAILGEGDMKVLPYQSVYKTQVVRAMDADGKVKPRFAAEQQISTALVTLTSKDKRRVAFVRSGGPPVALSLPMVGYEGMFAEVADRLREYNVEIVEKDISGAWQMQAQQMQMQGLPLPPEATDEQLKDAVWIVMVSPQDPRQMMQNPSAGQLGPKVNEHLRNGGSAMVLFDPQSEKFDFLKEWGVEARPEYLIVHEKVEPQGAQSADRTADWKRQQPVFVLDKYGDHLVTRPLESLDGLFVPLVPINTVSAKGVKTTAIMPIPPNPKPWGEGDFNSLRQRKPAEFNPKAEEGALADLSPPLFGGAIAEKDDGKGRLIAIGCRSFASGDYINEPDTEVLRTQRRMVPRFPANAELFVNSVFWLCKMDTMIAISPTALEVPRVRPIGDGVRDFWRWGVLTAGLPLMALMAGMFVYFKRRD